MALGDPAKNYSVSVIAQVCDIYGECALSNIIPLQVSFVCLFLLIDGQTR